MARILRNFMLATAMIAGLSACNKAPVEAPVTADTTSSADAIYVGGQIATMNDAQPDAEALAVKDGKILAVGSKADIEKAHKGNTTEVVDLAGKTLMPGFIDGHAHAQQFGTQAVGANLLAPPDGTVNNIDDLVAQLKTFSESQDVALTGWIFGMGYDDALLGRHPTRQDLDKVSTTVPVMATHISGHFAAVNTLGLKLIGFDASTVNPEGGVIRREADGKTPNGVLEELAAM
ncbi:MAG TPA: amidohydrolase family protein, partial [Arenimonas sp.]|nr:amidohydrolase family protein [Arenimonas sp.]